MKRIYILLAFVFVALTAAWGQGGRVKVLAGPDTTVYSTRGYAEKKASDAAYKTKLETKVTDVIVSSDSIVKYPRYVVAVKNDTIGEITSVTLPDPANSLLGKTIFIVDSSSVSSSTFLQSASGIKLRYNDQYASAIYLDRGQSVDLLYTDSTIVVVNRTEKKKTITSPQDFVDNRFLEGEQINYNGGRYVLQKSAPSTGISIAGFPVLEWAVYGENLLHNSRTLTDGGIGAGLWNFSSAMGSSIPNIAFGPDGQKKADGLKKVSTGTGTFKQRVDVSLYPLNIGDKLTYSFWYKAGEAASNNNARFTRMRLEDAGGVVEDLNPYIIQPDTINKRWQKFEYTFTANKNFTTNYMVTLYFAADVGDTTLVDMFQLERVPSASKFKETASTNITASDTSYAVYQDVDGLIRLSEVNRGEIASDVEFLQKAALYAATFSPRKNVVVDMPLEITSTYYNDSICIALPENVSLLGMKKSYGQNFTLTFDVNDTTAIGIYYLNDASGVYNEGQHIYNLNFVASSGLKRFVSRGETSGSIIENCSFKGEDVVIEGIKTGRLGGWPALFSYINNTAVSDCRKNIIYENCGADHYITRGNSRKSSEAALYINSYVDELSISDWDAENNDTYVADISGIGKEIIFNECYFENASFYFDSCTTISFIGGRMSDGGFYWGDNVSSVHFDRINFNTMLPKIPYGVRGTFTENIFSRARTLYAFDSYYDGNKYVTRTGNLYTELPARGVETTRNSLPYADLIGGRLDGLLTGYLSDTMVTDNVTLIGGAENLLTYSDSIGPPGTGTRLTTINDQEVNPLTGLATVDYITAAIEFGSPFEALRTWVLPVTLQEGEPVVFSCDVKIVSSSYQLIGVAIRVGATEYNRAIFPQSQEWQRMEFLVDEVTSNTTNFQFGASAGFVGDTIAIRNLSLTRGVAMRSFIPTVDTAIVSTNPGFKIPSGKKLILEGDVAITGTLTADSTNLYTRNITATTTDGAGQVTVTHNLGTTPVVVHITPETAWHRYYIIAKTSTTFTVEVEDKTTDLPAASTAVQFGWTAFR